MFKMDPMTKIKIRLWYHNTWINKFYFVYILGFINMMHTIFKHKFNTDKINREYDLKLREVKYRLKKAQQRNIELEREKHELDNQHQNIINRLKELRKENAKTTQS